MTTVMKQKEVLDLFDSLKYGHGNIISKNENYVVTRPLNSWDMNYRLYDNGEGVMYLIDVYDVYDKLEEAEQHGGILFQDLVDLRVEEIKEIAWKTEKDTLD